MEEETTIKKGVGQRSWKGLMVTFHGAMQSNQSGSSHQCVLSIKPKTVHIYVAANTIGGSETMPGGSFKAHPSQYGQVYDLVDLPQITKHHNELVLSQRI